MSFVLLLFRALFICVGICIYNMPYACMYTWQLHTVMHNSCLVDAALPATLQSIFLDNFNYWLNRLIVQPYPIQPLYFHYYINMLAYVHGNLAWWYGVFKDSECELLVQSVDILYLLQFLHCTYSNYMTPALTKRNNLYRLF